MGPILTGVAKFQREIFPKHEILFQKLADGQNPQALFITCADSRIDPALLTQGLPGNLFICRNAGNMVPPYGEMNGGVSATIEYAVAALKVQHVIVCGHSLCGAIHGLLHPGGLEGMPTVKSWLAHGEVARQIVKHNHPGLSEEETLLKLTEQNVVAQLQNLRTHPSVAVALAAGNLLLHGWMYYIETGEVCVYEPDRSSFISLEEFSALYQSRDSLAGVSQGAA